MRSNLNMIFKSMDADGQGSDKLDTVDPTPSDSKYLNVPKMSNGHEKPGQATGMPLMICQFCILFPSFPCALYFQCLSCFVWIALDMFEPFKDCSRSTSFVTEMPARLTVFQSSVVWEGVMHFWSQFSPHRYLIHVI